MSHADDFVPRASAGDIRGAFSGAIKGNGEPTPLPPLRIVASPGLRDRANNPYTWLTHEPMLKLGGAITEFSFYRPIATDTQILHIHWPERIFWGRISQLHPLLSAVYSRRMLTAMDTVRRNGGFVVWTAHNIKPHESFGPARDRMWQQYFEAFRRRIDLVISLSAWAERELIAAYPDLRDKRRTVIPHPHYRTAYPKPPKRDDARAEVGLSPSAFVLLAAGTIRRSKGIVELAERFARIARRDETLLIAGACDDTDTRMQLQDIADAADGSILLRLGRVPDELIGTTVTSADLSIFNFRSILNSGSVLLSLSFDTPVYAPEFGSLKELSSTLGPRWFLPLAQPLSDEGLRAAIDHARRAKKDRHDRPTAPLEALDPETIATRVYAEYASLMTSRRDDPAPSLSNSAG